MNRSRTWIAIALSMTACARVEETPTPDRADGAEPKAPSAAVMSGPYFVDVAADAGIDFVHNTGAFGRKWLPETMGSGCAWLDYDGDQDPDLLLLSGRDFAGHPTGRRQTVALFENDGGRFTDVTARAGLDEPLYAIGATYGDYDGDGDADLYVTAVGPNRLYRNDGGTFRDVAPDLGLADPGFGSSASWFDFDRDGDLDLMALNYVPWSPESDVFCSLDGSTKSYCTPEVYPGASPRLFRNDGARFADVTHAAGVFDSTAKGLGIACFDFDGDGWEDVFIANDTQPDFLFQNLGDGTFREIGTTAGVAYDESGRARGGMGVDVADLDATGRPSVAIGNFSNEMLGLYHYEPQGFFIDVAPTTAVGRQSLLTLAFGLLFFDADLDGRVDLFVANGHVEDDIEKVQARVAHAQTPHLFQNLGEGRFQDVADAIPDLKAPMVARGAAAADFDGDGDWDVAVNVSGGRAKLFRNDGANEARSVAVRLAGAPGGNPDGYGARLTTTCGGRTQATWFGAARSYASQSQSLILVGLGDRDRLDEIVVRWPSGRETRATDVPAGAHLTLREPTDG